MSKSNKKKIVTVSTGSSHKAGRKRTAGSNVAPPKNPLIFGKQNYIYLGIGFALILIGLLLMQGGAMPNPDVWDESLIYSFRRITLAPLVMIAGFAMGIYAIFK